MKKILFLILFFAGSNLDALELVATTTITIGANNSLFAMDCVATKTIILDLNVSATSNCNLDIVYDQTTATIGLVNAVKNTNSHLNPETLLSGQNLVKNGAVVSGGRVVKTISVLAGKWTVVPIGIKLRAGQKFAINGHNGGVTNASLRFSER